MTGDPPRVSVVIPTRGRPELVRRAIRSVVAQTVRSWEAIVVVDGPDTETEAAIGAEPDDRVRLIVNERRLGGSEARNVGIRAARAEWIGLLDDDDEWLPDRLSRQLAELRDPRDRVVGFCRRVVRRPEGEEVLPRRAPRPGEHVSEYLWLRRTLRGGEGGIQTSSLLVPRWLLLEVPFDAALPRYQDADWMLRACASGATLEFCPEPLAVFSAEEARASITSSHAADWRFALEWIKARRSLVTAEAYAAFLLTRGGDLAAAARSPRGGLAMAREAFRDGRPTVTSLALFVGKWLTPPGLRRRVRAALRPRQPRGGSPGASPA